MEIALCVSDLIRCTFQRNSAFPEQKYSKHERDWTPERFTIASLN